MKLTVWTLTTDDGHGGVTSVFTTEDEAYDCLRENFAPESRVDNGTLLDDLTNQGVIVYGPDSQEIEVPGYEPGFVYGCIPPQSVEDYIKIDAEDGEPYDNDLTFWNGLTDSEKDVIASYAAEQAGEIVTGDNEYDAVRAAIGWYRSLGEDY